MNDMIEHFRNVLAARPADATFEPRRCKNRRETWIPVHGEKVTVWTTLHDPDRDITHNGTFVSQNDNTYRVILDGDEHPTPFSRRNKWGAILWRLDTRERGQITETER